MKVCFVTANYPPEANGGTEQVVVALREWLGEQGIEVPVISGSDQPHEGVDVYTHRDLRGRVHRLRRLANERDRDGFVRPRLLALVRDWLVREKPDVVHVHSMAAFGAGVNALAVELGIPVVMTFHDLYVTCARFFRLPAGGVHCPAGVDRTPCVTCVNDALQTDPEFVRAALQERDRLMREEVERAAVCTAPSATAAAFVRQCLPYGGRIEVIPHGLLRAVARAARAPVPVPGERLRVGMFGGLVPEKGVFELIDAVTPLPCELHLAGRAFEGELWIRLQQQEQRGLRYVLHGPYDADQSHPARRLHLAVFPSKCQETYGLVVDEALAHGVPVVCSDQGALAERAMTPGVVVTPIAELANVLRELVASPERLAALRAAIPAALPTIASSARRHLDLYRSLAPSA